ncbi:Sir2 family NAD+-dependent deacetylase [Arenicella xantha]|uniref:NAD-dependent protein deacylase n=1 Tax=Arenicella xantha TaxID=644221 RepID=A0A395JV72_9GAMM|nr:Sir2 family NAD+-dependent deacetylase [Arenicella xantha]RBP53458.1 NAD-dependent deacetylase [Arenicella xantha]
MKPNYRDYSSIVVLTGAGISAESGIKTFRASDGLWEEHRIEDVATPEGFARDPMLVHRFYNQRREPLLRGAIDPNPAHVALVQLEQKFNGDFLLVTQNIDNLHELAGSSGVRHMHGEILKMRCTVSGEIFACHTAISVDSVCACCQRAGSLRPHIVWFGEMPLYMDEIYSALASCDLFLSIGTSGNVYPAAGFVQAANQAGATTIEINLEASSVASEFDHAVYAKAGEALPNWVASFLS